MDHHLNRRESLVAAGAAGSASPSACAPFAGSATLEAAGACVLQREVTEGPYDLDLDLVRRDIRGGRKGTPLTLRRKGDRVGAGYTGSLVVGVNPS